MSALYEYSAFGEVLQMESPYAVKNDYRFSTKPQEGLTGLYYYGYRWYGDGRWLSRDPADEEGGLNIPQGGTEVGQARQNANIKARLNQKSKIMKFLVLVFGVGLCLFGCAGIDAPNRPTDPTGRNKGYTFVAEIPVIRPSKIGLERVQADAISLVKKHREGNWVEVLPKIGTRP